LEYIKSRYQKLESVPVRAKVRGRLWLLVSLHQSSSTAGELICWSSVLWTNLRRWISRKEFPVPCWDGLAIWQFPSLSC